MHVYLCGADGLMAEHGLYGSEVGAAFEERCGETVAKGVGRYGLLDAGSLYEPLDNVEYHDTCEALATTVAYKDIVFVAGLDVYVTAVGKVHLEFVDGTL